MAALLPPCGHLPDLNEYALCSLFFCLMHDPSPPPPCMVHPPPPNLYPSDTTSPAPPVSPLSSPSLTPLYVLLHGLWRPHPHPHPTPGLPLACHWPATPQDHSGTLGAEEFKACLISLGFDIANDAQVLRRGLAPTARRLTGFSFCSPSIFYPPSLPAFPADPSSPNLWLFPRRANIRLHGRYSFPPKLLPLAHPSLLPSCPCSSPSPWSHG